MKKQPVEFVLKANSPILAMTIRSSEEIMNECQKQFKTTCKICTFTTCRLNRMLK